MTFDRDSSTSFEYWETEGTPVFTLISKPSGSTYTCDNSLDFSVKGKNSMNYIKRIDFLYNTNMILYEDYVFSGSIGSEYLADFRKTLIEDVGTVSFSFKVYDTFGGSVTSPTYSYSFQYTPSCSIIEM